MPAPPADRPPPTARVPYPSVPGTLYAPAAPPAAAEPGASTGLGAVVFLGGILLAAAQVVLFVRIVQDFEDLDGLAIAMAILTFLGSMTAGLGLLAMGSWGTRSPGARAAFLLGGVFFLLPGGLFSGLGLFGRFFS